jgi:hypothetical protein
MTALTHTVFPGFVPDGFFDEDNIEFIRNKAARVLKNAYVQTINFDRASVIRIMLRVIGERLERIPMMNQRVIMYLCNEYITHQDQIHKHLKWEEHYEESQLLYDASTERTFDTQIVKLANRLGKERVGGTVRFMFI